MSTFHEKSKTWSILSSLKEFLTDIAAAALSGAAAGGV
jgi:hypothetical protein